MGIFDGIQSALSSAWSTATSWASGAASTVSSWASGAARTVSGIAGSLPRIPLPSASTFQPPRLVLPNIGAVTEAGYKMVQQAAADAAKVAKDPVKLAVQAAQAAGGGAAAVAEAANRAYRIANGLPVETARYVAPVINLAQAQAAQAAKAITEAPANIQTFAAPTAEAVQRQIAAAASTATSAGSAAVKTATTAADSAAKTITAIPSIAVSVPTATIQTFSAPASSLLASAGSAIPNLSGAGSILPSAPKGGNVIDQVIGARNNSYDYGGEMFARGFEGNDAIGAASGAGIFAATTAIDMLAPADALNVGNKIATGRIDQISGDEWIAGGIDVALLGVGAVSGGSGYVVGRGLLKGGKLAAAAAKGGAKLSEKVSKTKAAKDAAAAGAMAAIGAAAGGKNVFKLSKLLKPAAKKAAKPAVKSAAKKAAPRVVKQAAPKVVKQAAPKVVRKAAPKVTKVTRKAVTAPTKKVSKTVNKAAPSSSIRKTTKTPTKTNAPTTAKGTEAATKAAAKDAAAIETAAKPGSSMLRTGAIALGAGITGIGLASYLGGSGADQAGDGATTDPNDLNGNGIPDDQEVTGQDMGRGYVIDPAGEQGIETYGPGDPEAVEEACDLIDQMVEDGTITEEEGEAAKEEILDQQDENGGNFPAAIGSDTPYQDVENIAQDLTRYIPGDPLEWFRQHGLAAPALAALVIIVLLVVWWIWKRFSKKGKKAEGNHRHGHRKGNHAAPAQSGGGGNGNKIVVV